MREIGCRRKLERNVSINPWPRRKKSGTATVLSSIEDDIRSRYADWISTTEHNCQPALYMKTYYPAAWTDSRRRIPNQSFPLSLSPPLRAIGQPQLFY